MSIQQRLDVIRAQIDERKRVESQVLEHTRNLMEGLRRAFEDLAQEIGRTDSGGVSRPVLKRDSKGRSVMMLSVRFFNPIFIALDQVAGDEENHGKQCAKIMIFLTRWSEADAAYHFTIYEDGRWIGRGPGWEFSGEDMEEASFKDAALSLVEDLYSYGEGYWHKPEEILLKMMGSLDDVVEEKGPIGYGLSH